MPIHNPFLDSKHIIFFNEGNLLTSKFDHSKHPYAPNRGYCYFWVHERFYSHYGIRDQSRYLHLFVRDPRTITWMRPRWDTWESAIEQYDYAKNERDALNARGEIPTAPEPPMICIKDILYPDIIFDFEKEGADTAVILSPESHAGRRVRLFDKRHVPIPFREVPEIVEILPQIREAFPPVE